MTLPFAESPDGDSSQPPSTAMSAEAPQPLGPQAASHRGPARRPNKFVAAVSLLGRFLYNHNPFYVASAWMVFRGLRATFATGDEFFPSGMLTLSLMAYIVLLAATAVLVVRYGKVWDDARTILLLIVLMLLGVSVTLDDILAKRPGVGVACGFGGWFFAVLVSEGVLRSLRLRLPGGYRAGYHTLLALFFLYPLSTSPFFADPDRAALKWILYGFSWAVGLALLTLLPAVRRGPAYIDDNGSPWRWPLYPWTLFGALIGCASLRAWYLCYSLHFVDYEDTIFGLYFLVPIVLAVGLLVSEAGSATNSALLKRMALAAPLVALWLAAVEPRSDRVYHGFLTLYQQTLGSPISVTLALAALFYGAEALRKREAARAFLTGTLILLASSPDHALGPLGAWRPQPWAFGLIALWQVWLVARRPRAVNLALAIGCALAAWVSAAPLGWLASHQAAPAWNLGLAGCLIAAAICKDATAPWIERLGAWALALLALMATLDTNGRDLAPLRVVYPPLVAAGLVAYAAARGHWRRCALPAAAPLSVWLAQYGVYGFEELRRHVHGLAQLLWGLVFFLCAALVSLLKTSAGHRWAERCRSALHLSKPPRVRENPQA